MDHTHDSLCKQATPLALRAEALVAPEHERPQLLLRMIVRGFDVLTFNESPQGFAVQKDIRTRAAHPMDLQAHGLLQPRLYGRAQHSHGASKLRARHRPIAYSMPRGEDELGEKQESLAYLSGRAAP